MDQQQGQQGDHGHRGVGHGEPPQEGIGRQYRHKTPPSWECRRYRRVTSADHSVAIQRAVAAPHLRRGLRRAAG